MADDSRGVHAVRKALAMASLDVGARAGHSDGCARFAVSRRSGDS